MITGPNSGGKSRLLQALGLVQLLGQSGLPVPARHAELWFRTGLFVSMIETSSAAQTEGRLGTELLRVRRLFESVPRGALVLLDELCSGTNPTEGEQIVEMVLRLLGEFELEAYVTTHFLRFAQRLDQDPEDLRLRFLQVQLDGDDNPTYQFVPGVAQSSLAGRTAQRLGVSRSELARLVAGKPPLPADPVEG